MYILKITALKKILPIAMVIYLSINLSSVFIQKNIRR